MTQAAFGRPPFFSRPRRVLSWRLRLRDLAPFGPLLPGPRFGDNFLRGMKGVQLL
jgi:hypothetical protein